MCCPPAARRKLAITCARAWLPSSMWLGLAARDRWQKAAAFLTLPSRVIRRGTSTFQDTKPCEMSGSAHVVVMVTARIRRQLKFCDSSMGTRESRNIGMEVQPSAPSACFSEGTDTGQAPSSHKLVYMTATFCYKAEPPLIKGTAMCLL